MGTPKLPVSAFVAVASFFVASRALCAACCGDGGSLGQRLTRDERAAFTIGPTLVERFGGWGASGAYVPLAKGDHDRQVRLDATWVLRGSSRLELGLSLPLQVAFRALGGASEIGGGFGDATAFARFTVAAVDDTTPWPAVFVTSTVLIPTGRPPRLASPLGASATGQGVPELRTAVSLEKAWNERWFAQASGGVGMIGPSDAGGVLVARRPRWTTGLVTGPIVALDPIRALALGAGLSYETEAAAAIDGVHEGTARSKLGLLASGALDLTGHLGLLAALRTALPVSSTGSNETATLEATLALRFAFHLTD